MNNQLLSLNLTQVKSALVSAALTALLAMAGYIISVGDIFAVDLYALANAGSLAALTGIVSLLKSTLTTPQGNFVGAVKIN